jgi:hypothetical protein
VTPRLHPQSPLNRAKKSQLPQLLPLASSRSPGASSVHLGADWLQRHLLL